MLEGILFFPSQVSNLGGEGVGEGESEESLRKTSPAACWGGSKKGRTTPLYLEGLKLALLGGFVNLFMKLPETSTLPTTGKKVGKRKKARPPT